MCTLKELSAYINDAIFERNLKIRDKVRNCEHISAGKSIIPRPKLNAFKGLIP